MVRVSMKLRGIGSRRAAWWFFVFLGFTLLHCSEQKAQTDPHTEKPVSTWQPAIIQGFYPYYTQHRFHPSAHDLKGLTHVSNAFISANAKGDLVIPDKQYGSK